MRNRDAKMIVQPLTAMAILLSVCTLSNCQEPREKVAASTPKTPTTRPTNQQLREELVRSKTGNWEEALAELEQRGAAGVISEALQKRDDLFLVLRATETLERLGDRSVVPQLVSALEHFNSQPSVGGTEQELYFGEIRAAIVHSLSKLTGQHFQTKHLDKPVEVEKIIVAAKRWMKETSSTTKSATSQAARGQ